MITKGKISALIASEAFIFFIIILVKDRPIPVLMTFNSKVVICFTGKQAVAIIAFQKRLGKFDACRYTMKSHFFHGDGSISFYVCRSADSLLSQQDKGRNNQKIDKTTITPYRLQTIQMYL
jgi:hypothetical protein